MIGRDPDITFCFGVLSESGVKMWPIRRIGDSAALCDPLSANAGDTYQMPRSMRKDKKKPMKSMRNLLFAIAVLASFPMVATAQTKKPTGQTPAKNITQAQGQLQGGDGVFKSVYTMNSGFNFTILSARYTIEPFNAYYPEIAGPDQKLLVLTVAIKNANPEEEGVATVGFTAVDDHGNNYSGNHYRLASLGVMPFAPSCKPGQGYGQDPSKDELTAVIVLPAKAKITKLLTDDGRKFVPGEKVIRYFIAGAAKKDPDGADGNPKNVITGFPDSLRDPADPSGATPLEEAKATPGVFMTSGCFGVRLDGITTSTTEKINEDGPEDGKVFVIATMTIKNIYGVEVPVSDLAWDEKVPLLTDSDGEKYRAVGGSRKVKGSEGTDGATKLQPGETYTLRFFFQLPKAAQPKMLTFGQVGGHHYTLDVSALK